MRFYRQNAKPPLHLAQRSQQMNSIADLAHFARVNPKGESMDYDEKLAERARQAIGKHKAVTEKKMFGGIAFLHEGRMFLGVLKDELMARIGPEQHDEAVKQPGARIMDFTGKPMKGYVFVS